MTTSFDLNADVDTVAIDAKKDQGLTQRHPPCYIARAFFSPAQYLLQSGVARTRRKPASAFGSSKLAPPMAFSTSLR